MKDLSKPVLIEGISESVVVFFQDDGSPDHKMRWSGAAFHVQSYPDGTWDFYSNESSNLVKDKDKAERWFHFSFVWRGVWEGRFYPKQEEFLAENIAELAEMWRKIEKILKDKIKADNPEYGHFDE